MSKAKINKSNVWISVVLIATVILIVSEIICANVLSDSDISNNIQKSVAGWVSLYAIITFVFSIVTVFNVEKWFKIIPIITALITIPIFGLAFFAFGFIGYGSPQ